MLGRDVSIPDKIQYTIITTLLWMILASIMIIVAIANVAVRMLKNTAGTHESGADL